MNLARQRLFLWLLLQHVFLTEASWSTRIGRRRSLDDSSTLQNEIVNAVEPEGDETDDDDGFAPILNATMNPEVMMVNNKGANVTNGPSVPLESEAPIEPSASPSVAPKTPAPTPAETQKATESSTPAPTKSHNGGKKHKHDNTLEPTPLPTPVPTMPVATGTMPPPKVDFPTPLPTPKPPISLVDELEQEAETAAEDPYVQVVTIFLVVVAILLLVCVAQQMVENPDGLCAKCCRCTVAMGRCLCCFCCCLRRRKPTHQLVASTEGFDDYNHDLALS